MAAPCNDDSRTLRNEFPSVVPNPRSSGSQVNFAYVSGLSFISTDKRLGLINSRQFLCMPSPLRKERECKPLHSPGKTQFHGKEEGFQQT
jgi:hypothetical protein